ncbi:hypothetical protein HPB47_027610 [Ixodes persulcatus]|uniref:Uncharacterized protein n=1 Tax=Ixodes persulcatus TaxID=34615 RepID=A0AC60PVF5_IXOPE|nr:hypothetical protein HPB47_027610 [Ixodes persulcatus]
MPAGVLAPQPYAGSPGAPSPVKPTTATKARLLLPVPGTTGTTGTGTVDPVTPLCEYDRVFKSLNYFGNASASHPEARSREAPSSLVESTSGLQPARALQARLPLPIPSMTPGFRALDEPTSEVTNHRSSTPKPYEGDQSAGPVSSGDELNMPWYAENDDGLEHMSDDSGDLDSGTSSDMEVQTSVLKLQATWSWVRSAQVAITLRVLKSLNIAMITERMYYYYQSGYLLPVVNQLLEELRGKNLDLAGDGRCDSPGFCAKYCTYTFYEASTKKLIHIEQVQVHETADVPSSNAMKKVAFLRGLSKLKDQGFTIASFTLDNHPSVECHMRTMESGTKHYFDTWHISKMPPFQGMKKKPLAASHSGPCKDLEVWVQQVNNRLYYCAAPGKGNGPLLESMWMSLLNHVINKHDGHDGPYHECLHQPLSDRAWLAVVPPAYEKLRSIVASPRLHNYIQHLSPGSETYNVEGFNSLLIGFASKSWVFSPKGMRKQSKAKLA